MSARKLKTCLAVAVLATPLALLWWTRADAFTTTLNVKAIHDLASAEGTSFSFDQVVTGPWDVAILRSGYDSFPIASRAVSGLGGRWRLPIHVRPELMHDGRFWIVFAEAGEVVGYWSSERASPQINLRELEQRAIRQGGGEEFIAVRERHDAGFESVVVKVR